MSSLPSDCIDMAICIELSYSDPCLVRVISKQQSPFYMIEGQSPWVSQLCRSHRPIHRVTKSIPNESRDLARCSVYFSDHSVRSVSNVQVQASIELYSRGIAENGLHGRSIEAFPISNGKISGNRENKTVVRDPSHTLIEGVGNIQVVLFLIHRNAEGSGKTDLQSLTVCETLISSASMSSNDPIRVDFPYFVASSFGDV
mmetsp:Transcript_2326/g.3461  ORF Transcript_2326/g.3461 Transcript_2326/m.3461 type:complete len:200 (+) Transcript_2326:874-1473(+)